MPTLIESLAGDPGLFCPDDSHRLEAGPEYLACISCGRRYPLHESGVIELLPKEPTPLDETVPQSYRQAYLAEFTRPFAWNPHATAWSAPETLPGRLIQRRRRQAEWYISLLNEGDSVGETVLCDLSAGSGYYTLDHASRFRLVMHCDLSVDSLNYALAKARLLAVPNLAFLRIDYFRPPFRSSLERVICCDTLIRGVGHDQQLLKVIRRSLKPGGRALVDFHNWWHNPLRRLGLMSKNFGDNVSYSRRQMHGLIRTQQITQYEAVRFHQEFDPASLANKCIGRFVPATRFVFRMSHDA